jgi:UDP:flavonoid glycosyltransferase YjiC (YdhE family)
VFDALSAGLPLLLAPQAADQFYIASRVDVIMCARYAEDSRRFHLVWRLTPL